MLVSWRSVRLARASSVSWKPSGSVVSRTTSPAGLTVDSSAAFFLGRLCVSQSAMGVTTRGGQKYVRGNSRISLPSTKIVWADARRASGSALARRSARAKEAILVVVQNKRPLSSANRQVQRVASHVGMNNERPKERFKEEGQRRHMGRSLGEKNTSGRTGVKLRKRTAAGRPIPGTDSGAVIALGGDRPMGDRLQCEGGGPDHVGATRGSNAMLRHTRREPLDFFII